MEFLYASANGFLVIITLEYAEWTMLLGCTEAACVRDFLLSTLFYTLATPCQYASGYTTCGVRDFGNSTLHEMPLFSTYSPYLLSSTYALSNTKFNKTWLPVQHDRASDCAGERRLRRDSTLQVGIGLLKEIACGCCFFFVEEIP